MVDDDGTIVECVAELSDRHAGVGVSDHGDRLVMPGFTDAHVHASRLPIAGLQGGMELIDWLQALAFSHEARFGDPDYADAVYRRFVESLRRNGITSSVVLGTAHPGATGILVDALVAAGLKARVSKVSLDRNGPHDSPDDTEREIADSRCFIRENLAKSALVVPASRQGSVHVAPTTFGVAS